MSLRTWLRDDYYANLGVAPDASDEEIARAFRELAKVLHPDRAPDESERFKVLTTAYDVVGNPARRREYDAFRRDGKGSPPAPPATVARIDGPDLSSPLSVRFLSTRRRGRWALGAGVALLVAGVIGIWAVLAVQRHEAAQRARTVAASATRVIDGDRSFLTFTTRHGAPVRVPEPGGPGGVEPGAHVAIRYDPTRPTRVLEDADRTARDITFWIVAIKLVVCGALFAALGARRLRHP